MMAKTRTTGPRVTPNSGTGPRLSAPQPAPPPTVVQLGSDRLLAGGREVDFAQLAPDLDQPRRHMDPARLEELAASIAAHGVLQPLVVRQDGLGREGDMRYTVVAGGRRYAAIRLLLERALDEATRRRVTRVPVVVNDSAAAERRVLQLIENLQREDLNPVEEARALKEIMRIERLTTTGLAERVHRSQGYVDERLRLLRHEDVEEAVETGLVPKSTGAAIASLPTADERQAWLERARAGETIRARDVYASKPARRRGQATSEEPGGLPKFGNPEAGQTQNRIQQLHAEVPNLTAPQAYHLATREAQGRIDTAVDVLSAPPVMTEGSSVGEGTRRKAESHEDHVACESAALAWLRNTRERLGALPSPVGDAGRTQLRAELLALRGAVDAMLDRLAETSPTPGTRERREHT